MVRVNRTRWEITCLPESFGPVRYFPSGRAGRCACGWAAVVVSWDCCWVGCRWGRGAARYCVADAVCRVPRWIYFVVNAENPNPVVEWSIDAPFPPCVGDVKEGKGEKGGKRISLEESVVETREGLATMTLSTMRDEEELPVVF